MKPELTTFSLGLALVAVACLLLVSCSDESQREIAWRLEKTALNARESADSLARRWEKDASLIRISGPGPGSTLYEQRDGTLLMVVRGWAFLYRYGDSIFTVNVGHEGVPTTDEGPAGKWQDELPISEIEVDSDVAMIIATSNDGIPFHPDKGRFILRMWKTQSGNVVPVWATPCESPTKGRVYVRADIRDVLWSDDLVFE
jgi:hypothetical protein